MIAKGTKCLHGDKEDSDHTARMLSLICVFVGRICQKVRFLTLWLKCFVCLSFLTMTNREMREELLFMYSKMANETNLSSKLPFEDRTREV